ncbi:hypothetical protein LJC63_00605 [Ruminococcaceae bacterium OttesenSCG-928-L11]|nr:hypothetical protein [Ruminococcaceae bacterium OttesenSCG-928-L11]
MSLKQLQDLTAMIEESTHGRQRLILSFPGCGVDVQTDNEAYTGLLIRQRPDYDTGDITLEFQATIRRMGSWMNGQEFRFAAEEIQEMNNLLYELEQTTITVSPEEMEQWAKWLSALRVDQALAQAHEREPQLDCQTGSVPTMGMV